VREQRPLAAVQLANLGDVIEETGADDRRVQGDFPPRPKRPFEEVRVRTRLPAGGSRIRTIGPRKTGVQSIIARRRTSRARCAASALALAHASTALA
jgi:hypothetical protein